MKQYKYINEIQAIETAKKKVCVTTEFKEREQISFRWTFETIADPRNFIPMAKSEPNYSKSCKGWSLSLFDSELHAIARWEKLSEGKENFWKRVGSHLSRGLVEKTDGKCDVPNEIGHFDLFEYAQCDLSKKFVVIKELIKDSSDESSNSK